MQGLPAIIVGILWYALFYLRHTTAPTAGFAEFTAPAPLGRLFRRGGGAVRISALVVQVWAVALAVTGVLAVVGVVPDERAPSVLLGVTQYGVMGIGLLWLVIVWLGRGRHS
jgi:hypothetical protein